MEIEMDNNIKTITFPNTVDGSAQNYFRSPEYSFKIIQKNGEMASINWIEVWKGETKIAEIKESVCDIYFI